MALGIMADNDVDGQCAILLQILRGDTWNELWRDLHLVVQSFETLGILRTAPDVAVWHECQQRQIILVTGNRNDEGPDSLESTLQAHAGSPILPVITIANPKRIKHDRNYAERTAERLLEYLLDLERYRGVGRLYIP